MRKKLQELRNKEEGFTLVELLAVIVILGIILAIAIPAVGKVTEKAGKDADKAEMGLIVDAGRIYLTAEKVESVTVDKLLTDGYLEERDVEGLSGDMKNWTVKKVNDGNSYGLFDDDTQKYPEKSKTTS